MAVITTAASRRPSTSQISAATETMASSMCQRQLVRLVARRFAVVARHGEVHVQRHEHAANGGELLVDTRGNLNGVGAAPLRDADGDGRLRAAVAPDKGHVAHGLGVGVHDPRNIAHEHRRAPRG